MLKLKLFHTYVLFHLPMAICLVVYLFFGCTNVIAGEPERLAADRPGFAWGTHAVSPGSLYVEGGFQHSWNPTVSGFRYTNVPVLNFRTGIVDGFEVFVSWDGWESSPGIINNTDESFADGLTMPFVGGKLRLKDSDAISLTILGLLEPNQGDDFFAVNPSLGLLWETPLSETIDFFGMAMGNLEYTPEDTPFYLILAFGLGTSITSNIGAFLEYYTIANTAQGEWLHGNEAGIQFFLSDNIQLDVFAGFSHGNKSDHYAGLGIARRF